MATIRIVTDNGCDLPEDLLAERASPPSLEVRLGKTGAISLTGLSPEEFWKIASKSDALAETSAPAPGAFHDAFAAAAADGCAGVICVTLSSGLSATYQAALAGAEAFQGGSPSWSSTHSSPRLPRDCRPGSGRPRRFPGADFATG